MKGAPHSGRGYSGRGSIGHRKAKPHKMITLTNDFHNTSARLRLGTGDMLTARQIARARRKLCGISDCACGGDAGERGPQRDVEAMYRYPDGRVLVVCKQAASAEDIRSTATRNG